MEWNLDDIAKILTAIASILAVIIGVINQLKLKHAAIEQVIQNNEVQTKLTDASVKRESQNADIKEVVKQSTELKNEILQVAKHSNQMKDELITEVRKASIEVGKKEAHTEQKLAAAEAVLASQAKAETKLDANGDPCQDTPV